jgi:hypothetical protein
LGINFILSNAKIYNHIGISSLNELEAIPFSSLDDGVSVWILLGGVSPSSVILELNRNNMSTISMHRIPLEQKRIYFINPSAHFKINLLNNVSFKLVELQYKLKNKEG